MAYEESNGHATPKGQTRDTNISKAAGDTI